MHLGDKAGGVADIIQLSPVNTELPTDAPIGVVAILGPASPRIDDRLEPAFGVVGLDCLIRSIVVAGCSAFQNLVELPVLVGGGPAASVIFVMFPWSSCSKEIFPRSRQNSAVTLPR